jgi:tetratricopeptide (TPR) repeat protein
MGLLLLLVASTQADRGRKLPDGAYIKSAKIEMSDPDQDTARYRTAEYMLDSLFQWYGPHAEGLFLMGKLQAAWLAKISEPKQKKFYAERLAAYSDSLHLCCVNDKVKDKYRKKCDEYVPEMDSLVAQYWRNFYNEGVGQLGEIEETAKNFAAAADSSDRAFYEARLKRLVDSAITNLEMAVQLSPEDHRSYVGIAQVYEREKDYARANEWYQAALDKADTASMSSLYLSLAYNAYYLKDHCQAAEYMEGYLEFSPEDVGNMSNQGVFYNLCGAFDKAAASYQRILSVNPTDVDALVSLGQYFNQLARNDNDSATAARDAGNEELAETWMDKRSEMLDSSLHYFRTARESDPQSCDAAREFGIIAFVVGNYEEAAEAYGTITQNCNPEKDDWLTLGDTYIYLQNWEAAIAPYEKVIESEPENTEILERLVDLHKQTGDEAKAQEYQARLDAVEK